MKKEYISDFAATLLIMMFLYASFSKYFSFEEFERAMLRQPFRHWFGWILIIIVPPSEIITSGLLLFEKTRLIGLKISMVLMALFTGYIAAILMHWFPKVPCSCGGIIRKLDWGQHLIFNIFFLLLAVTGYIILNKQNKIKYGLNNRK